jgi:formyltetrahydrofolate synthetase
MQPTAAIAARLGLTDDLLEPYGRYTAVIRVETLER